MIRSLNPRRLWTMVVQLLETGLTPEKIALTIALGLVIGVIPVLGSTTVLCTAVALPLRLNLPLIQSVNYIVYPLQFALLIPFIRAGEWIFDSPRLPMSAGEIMNFVANDPAGAISALWTVTLQAVVAWAVFALVTTAVAYPALVPLLRRIVPRRERTP